MIKKKKKTRRLAGIVLVAAAALVLRLSFAANGTKGGGVPFFRSELIFDRIDGYPSSHAATITELPNGDLMAAWYSGEYEKAKDVAVFSSVRPGGGGSWSKPAILQDTPDLSEGNPVLYLDGKKRLWFFYVTMYGDMWTDCKVYYKTSDDGGKTWSKLATLVEQKGWMTRNKPIELKDGTLILPMYNEILWSPVFMLTKDGGGHWALKGEDLRVPGGAIQPSVIRRADGSLLAFLRTGEPGGNVWTVTSGDGGARWGNPARTALPNPNSAIDAVGLKSGAVAIAYNDSPYDRTPLAVALSLDDGKTWPYKKKIEKQFGEFSYPAIIQSGDGTIHIVYTYKRMRIKHAEFNEEWLKAKKD